MQKIAIISYNMYPYLFRPDMKISGGAELQLATLAKLLSEKGFKVVFLTGDFGQNNVVEKNGYIFYKLEVNGTGKRKKVLGFLKLIRNVRPDFLLERGTSSFTFPGVLFSRLLDIPYIFCGASDINFARNEIDPFFKGSKAKQFLYQWALRRVSHFVVQKNSQADLLKKNFRIETNVSLIRNFPPPINLFYQKENLTDRQYEYDAVWVANLIPYKQPELFIELARHNPKYKFLLIGASPDKEYDTAIKASAKTAGNLVTIGYIPPAEVIQWMRKCRIVVNTTRIASGYEEGFSNVQLMGWMCGLPSLALISDPDKLIELNQMGFCSGNFNQLCVDFRKLAENNELYNEMSQNAARYAMQNHNAEQLGQKYLEVFNLVKKVRWGFNL